jgi:hypothetical protein
METVLAKPEEIYLLEAVARGRLVKAQEAGENLPCSDL